MSNTAGNEQPGTAFERQARAAFDDSVAHLDAATLSRLNQSRQRALAAASGRRSSSLRWQLWAPAGALAAAALMAALLLRTPGVPETVTPVATNTGAAAADPAIDPLVIVAEGDDLDLAAEADLEFYAWIDLETVGDDGVT